MALVVERHRAHPAPRRTLTQEDERMLADVAAYITAHCADRLPLERLARIGCMGVSKLKDAFHARYGCTITQYIQGSGWSVRSSCWQIPTCRGPDRSNCGLSESQPFRGDLPAKHRTLPCGIPQSILQLLHGKNRHGKERSLIETKRPHGEHSAMRLLQSSAIGSTESAFPVFCPSRPAF